jgi:hypothetical protein
VLGWLVTAWGNRRERLIDLFTVVGLCAFVHPLFMAVGAGVMGGERQRTPTPSTPVKFGGVLWRRKNSVFTGKYQRF